MPEGIKLHVMNLLTHDDPDVRRLAAEELAEAEGEGVVGTLAAALWDENKGVRDAAVRALCQREGGQVARAIVDLIRDENIMTRNLIGELLLKWGKSSIPAVLPYLQDPSCDVRKFALDILGLIGTTEQVADIIPMLDDPDENVVLSTVEALGNIGGTEAVSPLIRMYDVQEYGKPFIAEALGKMGGKEAGDFLLVSLNNELGMPSPDSLLLFAIIEALGACGNISALEALQGHVGDVRGKLRSIMLQTIVQIAERLHLPVQVSPKFKRDFVETFVESDVKGKITSAKGLAGFIDPEIARMLMSSFGVAEELDSILYSILENYDDAFRVAVEMLQTTKASGRASRKEIAGLLGRLAIRFIVEYADRDKIPLPDALFRQAFEAVAAEWGPADEQSRAVIIDTLFRLDGDRAVEFVENVMSDPDRWLHIQVIELLARIGDRRAPDFIARFLTDDDEMVREVASSTLSASGFPVHPPLTNQETSLNN